MGHCVFLSMLLGSFNFDFFKCIFTSSSLNSSASLSIIFNAPWGQCPRHAPNPSQYASLTIFAFPFMICIAPSAQLGIHSPQPLHSCSFIWIIFLETIFLVSFYVAFITFWTIFFRVIFYDFYKCLNCFVI